MSSVLGEGGAGGRQYECSSHGEPEPEPEPELVVTAAAVVSGAAEGDGERPGVTGTSTADSQMLPMKGKTSTKGTGFTTRGTYFIYGT